MRFGLIIATKEMDNYDYNSLPAIGIGYFSVTRYMKLQVKRNES